MHRRVVAPLVALVLLGALRAASAPPWPDDWDGIGFIESVTRFDLDRFAPHPPGYPVYVALLRVAALFARSPIGAANTVAVLAGLVAAYLLTATAARTFGPARAAWIGVFAAVSPLVWRATTGVGSEAPALAIACVAVFGATCLPRAAPWWIGAAIGFGLGIRLSWAPLFLMLVALAPPGRRAQAILVACGSTLAWALPFVALVGARHLVARARAHATGHFAVWGGSAISEPGPRRALWLARDLFVDGLGAGTDPLGIAIALLIALLGALGLRAWGRRGYPNVGLVLLLLLPYLAWATLGQNLHQQPRHALPLVVVLACALALAATTSRQAQALGVAFAALVALRTADDARARRSIPPPGEQLVALARGMSTTVAVYGGPSARFFELDGPPSSNENARGLTVATLGDVRLAVGHLPSLPSHVLVTSELDGLSLSSYPLVPVATLCRPARIDRRAPCLDVFDWRAPFLLP